jgi:hypothetical protein
MTEIENIMQLLGCSEEQAKQVIESDKQVDKMTVRECESDLSQEQKAVAKKCRQGDRKPTVYNFTTREKKADTEKGGLIELFAAVLKEQPACNSVTVINAERQIDFEWNGRKLRIVLSAPRK